MAQHFGNAFLHKPQPKHGTATTKILRLPTGAKPSGHHPPTHHASGHHATERKLTFTKIFRWRPPEGQTHKPATVEIAGTFTNWHKVPMVHDKAGGGWHATFHHVPGNRTHHYMLLADGKPVQDQHCDGLAVPHGAEELQFAIATARGPRVFMLFSQTK